MAAIKRKADDTADGNVPSITMAKHKASDDVGDTNKPLRLTRKELGSF